MVPLTKRSKNCIRLLQHVTFVKKDSQKGLLMIKIIEKLENITILQANIEVKHIAYVIKL